MICLQFQHWFGHLSRRSFCMEFSKCVEVSHPVVLRASTVSSAQHRTGNTESSKQTKVFQSTKFTESMHPSVRMFLLS